MITGEQMRAARGMLRMNQRQFAEMAHVTLATIQRLERTRGSVVGHVAIVETILSAFEEAGIEFIDAGQYSGIGGPGVRLKGVPVVQEDVIDLEAAAEALDSGHAVAAPD